MSMTTTNTALSPCYLYTQEETTNDVGIISPNFHEVLLTVTQNAHFSFPSLLSVGIIVTLSTEGEHDDWKDEACGCSCGS